MSHTTDILTLYAFTVPGYKLFIVKIISISEERTLSQEWKERDESREPKVCIQGIVPTECHPSSGIAAVWQCHDNC